MHFYCERCKKEYPVATHAYACACGGLFRLYQSAMDAEDRHEAVTLGETETPLLPLKVDGHRFFFKMEDRQPTGSFKDRGASRLIGEIAHLGIERVVIDSAGNAGAAIAAYAAAAGIACRVYVPDDISPERAKQITAYGAEVIRVPNGRMNAGGVARAELGSDYYASHVYNPLFADGIKSMAHLPSARRCCARLHLCPDRQRLPPPRTLSGLCRDRTAAASRRRAEHEMRTRCGGIP